MKVSEFLKVNKNATIKIWNECNKHDDRTLLKCGIQPSAYVSKKSFVNFMCERIRRYSYDLHHLQMDIKDNELIEHYQSIVN